MCPTNLPTHFLAKVWRPTENIPQEDEKLSGMASRPPVPPPSSPASIPSLTSVNSLTIMAVHCAHGVAILGPTTAEQAEILTVEAQDCGQHHCFNARRKELLQQRAGRAYLVPLRCHWISNSPKQSK